YPVALPQDGRLGKGVLELELPLDTGSAERSVGERHPAPRTAVVDVPLGEFALDIDGVPSTAGGGAAEALLRP
ncbi:MAG: hypothetical protein ACRCY9_15990, partial [Phycicoccus sp.]